MSQHQMTAYYQVYQTKEFLRDENNAEPLSKKKSGVTLSSECKLVPEVFFVLLLLLFFILGVILTFAAAAVIGPHFAFLARITSVSVEPSELAVN